MLDPATVWTSKIAEIGNFSDKSGVTKLANTVQELTTGKLQIIGLTPPSTFTFDKSTFESLLMPLIPGPTGVGQLQFAAAWAAAMTGSQMVVSSGAYVGAPTPATTFSAPPVVVLLPPTIAAAQAVLAATLTAAAVVPAAELNIVGLALWTAFVSVQASVTGLNSVVPPAGPQPLVFPSLPLG